MKYSEAPPFPEGFFIWGAAKVFFLLIAFPEGPYDKDLRGLLKNIKDNIIKHL